jgi:hypothetical protein
MILHLPDYQPLPAPDPKQPLITVPIAALRPTQLCVGLAEVRSRQQDFHQETAAQRLDYLRRKPVPLVRGGEGQYWMVDRHHRLRPLMVLAELQRRGWLYLFDGRGQGPLATTALPASLHQLQDDPYRSLVWKLKKEDHIAPAPLIPFHEFRWGAWLRRRALPPFSSERLDPALPAARALVRSQAAAQLAGWRGRS